ncbi:response regulator transcription factor [Streptomyces sp. NPDC051014]|uniref:response regulator transcription factor n=1 Tax=Streptomyces TaxID=1883 RepID=UPI003407F87F
MRVVIAEDAAVLRELLAQMLTMRGHQVAASVADADALRAAVAEHRPDVAVVDIRMPPTHTDDGLRAAIDIREQHPGTGVLLFSQYVETKYATRLLAQGSAGVGYLLKERVANVAGFTDALERVAAGGTALDPEVVTQLAGAATRNEDLEALTDRERAVLTLMAEGRSNTAISQQLHVSAGTVEKHVAAIFGKLDLPVSEDHNRRVLAVIRMLRQGPRN